MRAAFFFMAGIVVGYGFFYAFSPRPDFRSDIHVEASQPINPTVVDPNPYLQDTVGQCANTLRTTIVYLQECTTKLIREIDAKDDCETRAHRIQEDSDHWQRQYQETKCPVCPSQADGTYWFVE